MKDYYFFLLSLFSLNIFSDLSIGSIEEVFIKNGSYERKIQIYNPFGKTINTDTTFIIMNDGEELFSEEDSWNGMSWNIDDSFLELYRSGIELNVVIIGINSAKRNKGNIIDETRRYAEYFPKESIQYFDRSLSLIHI